MSRRLLLPVLLLSSALVGCGDGTTEESRARQEALLHTIAQEVAELPGVVCVQASLDSQGLPTPPRGALFVRLTTDPELPDAQQRELTRETARRVWLSPLVVRSLDLNTNGTIITLAKVLNEDDTLVDAEDLEAAFGPQPPVPTPRPEIEDPGNPSC